MSSRHAVNEEPIPGYRLIEPLGSGGFGEVWKCEAPGGLFKAIKFVRGSQGLHDSGAAEQELRSLQHIKTLRHPFLLSIERVEVLDGDLVMVMELADKSLHDLLMSQLAVGQLGIARREALSYLRETAEVLDLLNQEHGLQHLDIKPRNLFLVNKHIKVADFGLVNSLAELVGEGGANLLGAITPAYASPETFDGCVSLFSDQYSLAVTYMELVTGLLPFRGKGMRELIIQVTGTEPDLSPLSDSDRPIVARAMSKEPKDRFASCHEFVEALEAASPDDTVARVRTRPTSVDFSLAELGGPPDVLSPSGVFRRQSRVLPVVSPTAAPTPQEGLGGLQLHECLNRGPLGELWRATGSRGEPSLVRFLTVPDGSGSGIEEALRKLVALRHPLLPDLRLVQEAVDRFALISAAGDASLASRFKECKSSGLPGIPRQELLGYLGQVADGLDELYHHHEIQHLALSPRHLALRRGGVLLLEFGLAEWIMLPLGQPPASLNPRYAAVELCEELISDACDQYSLALLYQELLVGTHPFRSLNPRQLTTKGRGQPELSLLPATDRPSVSRALSPEPDKRFRSCRDFVLALEEATVQVTPSPSSGGSRSVPVLKQSGVVPALKVTGVVPAVKQTGVMPALKSTAAVPALKESRTVPVLKDTRMVPVLKQPPAPPAEWVSAVKELFAAAEQGHRIESADSIHYRLTPGKEIEHRTWARLPAGMAGVKLDGFRDECGAEVVEKTDRRWLYRVSMRRTLLQRFFGKPPSVLVEVVLGPARGSTDSLTPLRVRVEPRDFGRAEAEQLLAEMGPALLASFNTLLGGQCTKAAQERYPLNLAVHVESGGVMSHACRTRDLGREEMTVLSPCVLPVGPVKMRIARWKSSATVEIPGRVLGSVPAGNAQFEVSIGLG